MRFEIRDGFEYELETYRGEEKIMAYKDLYSDFECRYERDQLGRLLKVTTNKGLEKEIKKEWKY